MRINGFGRQADGETDAQEIHLELVTIEILFSRDPPVRRLASARPQVSPGFGEALLIRSCLVLCLDHLLRYSAAVGRGKKMYSVRNSVRRMDHQQKKHFRNTKPSLSLALHRSGGHTPGDLVMSSRAGSVLGSCCNPPPPSQKIRWAQNLSVLYCTYVAHTQFFLKKGRKVPLHVISKALLFGGPFSKHPPRPGRSWLVSHIITTLQQQLRGSGIGEN